jgi:acetyltransferase
MLTSSASLEPETHTLKDGTQVVIRPILPEDADDLQATFKRLSPESIYLRFHSFKKVLPDKEAHDLATLDYTTRMAFVAICWEDHQEVVVGVARYALPDLAKPDMAESAVVVADEYQNRGIGKLLLRRLVTYARAKKIRQLRGNLQVGNTRMLDLVGRSVLPNKKRYVEGLWEVTIDLREVDEGV